MISFPLMTNAKWKRGREAGKEGPTVPLQHRERPREVTKEGGKTKSYQVQEGYNEGEYKWIMQKEGSKTQKKGDQAREERRKGKREELREGGREGKREGGGAYQRFSVCFPEPIQHQGDARYVVVGGADEGEKAFDRVLSVRMRRERMERSEGWRKRQSNRRNRKNESEKKLEKKCNEGDERRGGRRRAGRREGGRGGGQYRKTRTPGKCSATVFIRASPSAQQ